MIQLMDTLQFDETKIYQKEIKVDRLAFRVEMILVLLFLLSTAACGKPVSNNENLAQVGSAYAGASEVATSGHSEESDEVSCGRQNYPRYEDVTNQEYVQNEIASGKARMILHFNVNCDGLDATQCSEKGQAAINAFLARTEGIVDVGSIWPDWAAVSLTVNKKGLNQVSTDCSIRVIEADRREYPL